VVLHHAEAALQLEAGERSAEASERLAVRVADQEQVLTVLPLALGLEAQASSVLEGDRLQPLEADRPRLERLAVDPDR
jgi:hypothetical protein